jgi:CRP/FNR family transcriptional regulator, cyclic AMP receptor protein
MNDNNINEIVIRLQATALFSHFGHEDLTALARAGVLDTYEGGDVIIKEGEISPDFFVVISGGVNVMVRENDKDVFICMIGEGEIFGEAGIFARVKRTASVTAADKTSLLRLTREGFLSFVRSRSSAGVKILMIIVYSLLKKLRGVNQELAYERKFDVEQDDIDAIISEIVQH